MTGWLTSGIEAEPAEPEDELWERQAREMGVDVLPGLRAAAERWSAALGAGVAAAALAAVLKGPGDFDELDGWATTVGKGGLVAAALLGICATALAALAAQPRVGE